MVNSKFIFGSRALNCWVVIISTDEFVCNESRVCQLLKVCRFSGHVSPFFLALEFNIYRDNINAYIAIWGYVYMDQGQIKTRKDI